MRREGVPIEGFCVAAGIPSTEKTAEIIGGSRVFSDYNDVSVET